MASSPAITPPAFRQRPVLRSFLLIDSDLALTSKLKSDPEFATFQPTIATTRAEAWSALKNKDVRYGGIFLGALVPWPSVVTLIREAHAQYPATPLYLLYDEASPFTAKETLRLALQGSFKKPIDLKTLFYEVFPEGMLPPLPTKVVDVPAAASTSEDGQYIPVAAEEFLTGKPSHFDVFIRVPSGKHLKLISAKEVLEPQRVLKFIEQGAKFLFFKRTSQMACLNYCDYLAANLVIHPDVSLDLKTIYTAAVGQEFAQLTEKGKLEEGELEQSFGYLSRLFHLVKNQKGERKDLVNAYLKNAEAMEHAVSVSFACGLLASPLGIQSPAVFKQLGIASLLHDLGLAQMPPHFQAEKESALSSDEKELFWSHPEKGAEAVGRFKGVDSSTLQGIAQHHVRRDGSGFPKKSRPDQVHLFAEAIGICDEFIRLIRQRRDEPKFDVLGEMEREKFNGFSFPVIDAFKATFMTESARKAWGI